MPGVRDVYLEVGLARSVQSPGLRRLADTSEAPKIFRHVLASLFGCSQETLRNWERSCSSLAAVTNYAQCSADPRLDDQAAGHILTTATLM